MLFYLFFFFNDTATTEIYTLSLHDALPISEGGDHLGEVLALDLDLHDVARAAAPAGVPDAQLRRLEAERELHHRSEEHTSELQSQSNLVCRLLLEKKKKKEKMLQSTTRHAS